MLSVLGDIQEVPCPGALQRKLCRGLSCMTMMQTIPP